MIKIKCDKCGYESDNWYEFGRAWFQYLAYDNALQTIHLCNGCTDTLRLMVNEARAEFLGVTSVRGFEVREK